VKICATPQVAALRAARARSTRPLSSYFKERRSAILSARCARDAMMLMRCRYCCCLRARKARSAKMRGEDVTAHGAAAVIPAMLVDAAIY